MGELLRLLREGLTWDEALARLAGEGAEAVGSVQEWAQARLERLTSAGQGEPGNLSDYLRTFAELADRHRRGQASLRQWQAEREAEGQSQALGHDVVPRDPDVPSISARPSLLPDPLQRVVDRVGRALQPRVAGPESRVVGAARMFMGDHPAEMLDAPVGAAAGIVGRVGRAASAVGDSERFYSRLQRALDRFPDEAASPGNLRTYLSKQGVKDAEIDWVLGDLEDLAAEVPIRTGRGRGTRQRVALDDVRRRAEERAIQLEETVLGGEGSRPFVREVGDEFEVVFPDMEGVEPMRFSDRTEANDLVRAASQSNPAALVNSSGLFERKAQMFQKKGASDVSDRLFRQSEILTQRAEMADLGRGGTDAAPKFAKYTEPGGENYREVVLSLDPGAPTIRSRQVGDRTVHEVVDPTTGQVFSEEATREAAERVARSQGNQSQMGFTSQHYPDIDNPVVHIRMSDRVGPDGERVLHVEEIQSDWAAKGRREGFRTDETQREYERLKAEREEFKNEFSETGNLLTARQNAQIRNPEAAARELEISRRMTEISPNVGGVPDMPFRDTEDWLGLAVRRVLDEASVGNYDRIAWTPGARQAERYSEALQEAADRVTYNPRTKQLQAFRGDEPVLTETVPRERLPDFVGKDAADSLLEVPAQRGVHEISGTDLRVNDAGMIKLYDELLPGQLRRHARDLGVDVQIGDPPVRVSTDREALERSGTWNVEGPEMSAEDFRALARSRPDLRYAAELVEDHLSQGGDIQGAFSQLDTPSARQLAEHTGHTLSAEVAWPPGVTQLPGLQIPQELRARILQEGQRLLTPAALIGGGGLLGARGGLFSPPERR